MPGGGTLGSATGLGFAIRSNSGQLLFSCPLVGSLFRSVPGTTPGTLVGSRTGARTVGSGGLSKPFALGLSPAPMVTSPAPASSNGAGGFPALRFPDDFSPGVMGPLGQQRFRDRKPVPTPPGPAEVGLRPGEDPLPQVLPIVGDFIISPRPPMVVEECHQRGRFAPRALRRFGATTSPSATLSSSADFP